MDIKKNPKVKQLLQDYRRATVQSAHNSKYAPIRWSHLPEIACGAKEPYLSLSKMPFEERRVLLPDLFREIQRHCWDPEMLQASLSDAQVYGSFVLGGRLIFDVTKVLQANLLHMDIDRIECGVLEQVPNCYIGFGCLDIDFRGRNAGIEGVFVQAAHDREGRNTINIFPVGVGDRPVDGPLRCVTIALDDTHLSLQEAIAISAERTQMANAQMMAEMQATITRYDANYDRNELESFTAKPESTQTQIAGLVANALLFMLYVPDDKAQLTIRPPRADEFQRKVGYTLRTDRERAEVEAILAQDYVKLTRLGTMREVDREAVAIAGMTAGKKKTHLRRGHWREQPYGPDRSLRRVIEIKPMIINPHLSKESPGRIYEDRSGRSM